MTEDKQMYLVRDFAQEIKVLLDNDMLICPICGLPLHRHDPDDVYECPGCKAWFKMLSYGSKTVE